MLSAAFHHLPKRCRATCHADDRLVERRVITASQVLAFAIRWLAMGVAVIALVQYGFWFHATMLLDRAAQRAVAEAELRGATRTSIEERVARSLAGTRLAHVAGDTARTVEINIDGLHDLPLPLSPDARGRRVLVHVRIPAERAVPNLLAPLGLSVEGGSVRVSRAGRVR